MLAGSTTTRLVTFLETVTKGQPTLGKHVAFTSLYCSLGSKVNDGKLFPYAPQLPTPEPLGIASLLDKRASHSENMPGSSRRAGFGVITRCVV